MSATGHPRADLSKKNSRLGGKALSVTRDYQGCDNSFLGIRRYVAAPRPAWHDYDRQHQNATPSWLRFRNGNPIEKNDRNKQ